MIEIFEVTADDPRTVEAARHLLHHALPLDLGDDRFNHRWVEKLQVAADRYAGVVANGGGHPIGYLGGVAEGNTLYLEALVADHHRQSHTSVLGAMLELILGNRLLEGRRIELWGKPAMRWHEEVAAHHGLQQVRQLYQMRCPLPVTVDPLPTRPFQPGLDDEALRRLNNAAFEAHPDQGKLDPDQFAHRLAEPGVSPEGIRLYEADGELAGFCWTKIHHDRGLGEVWAIGLHPAMHGRGLGRSMTAAGLDWLHAQGLETGMLYVEADNEPAIHTYEKLGFDIVRTDRAWATEPPANATPAPEAAHPATVQPEKVQPETVQPETGSQAAST